MSLGAKELYELLPAVYRLRDAENLEPLKGLLSITAAQAAILDENIEQLYDDQFIETCAPWVIPYLGDLVGSNAIYEIDAVTSLRRAEVANTIGYRRRKGTLLALEQVAMDVAGRPAVAVEFFNRLITTESMRHVRPHHEAVVNFRHGSALDRINSAFNTLNYTVDVRRIVPRVRTVSDPDPSPLDINLHGGGRFNIPDIGIYLWRWKEFEISNAPAFPVDGRRYMFSPLGQNMPLLNQRASRESFSRLSTRLDVSQPISRREFYTSAPTFYGSDRSVAIFADGALVDASQICCCDLSDGPGQMWGCTPGGKIGIDPVLGRIQFGAHVPIPKELRVRYHYGFPAEIGGGPYDRTPSLPDPASAISPRDPSQFAFQAVVGSKPVAGFMSAPTLEQAITQWNRQPPGSRGLIILPGFEHFDVKLTGGAAIGLPPQSQLWMLSAQAPPSRGNAITYQDACVTLRGEIEIQGQAGQLFLSGLWLSGSIRIEGAANLQLMDCTLVPGISLTRDGLPMTRGEPSITASDDANLVLLRCIAGPLGVSTEGAVRICSSVIDSGSRCGAAYAGPDLASEGANLHIEDSTVIGKVRTRTMELASNTIFFARRALHDPWEAALWCSRKQAGCMRFCFLPADAITPRRFRCWPEDPSQEDLLLPKFVTLRYGHPSYALLSGDVPLAIWKGADNGSQIGVYNLLQETEAVRNVQVRAPEYLPFGLEAGIFLEPSRALILKLPPRVYGYGYGHPLHFDPCGDQDDSELRFVGVGADLL